MRRTCARVICTHCLPARSKAVVLMGKRSSPVCPVTLLWPAAPPRLRPSSRPREAQAAPLKSLCRLLICESWRYASEIWVLRGEQPRKLQHRHIAATQRAIMPAPPVPGRLVAASRCVRQRQRSRHATSACNVRCDKNKLGRCGPALLPQATRLGVASLMPVVHPYGALCRWPPARWQCAGA